MLYITETSAVSVPPDELPTTSNFAPGAVVPIPTFPLAKILILSTPAVEKPKSFVEVRNSPVFVPDAKEKAGVAAEPLAALTNLPEVMMAVDPTLKDAPDNTPEKVPVAPVRVPVNVGLFERTRLVVPVELVTSEIEATKLANVIVLTKFLDPFVATKREAVRFDKVTTPVTDRVELMVVAPATDKVEPRVTAPVNLPVPETSSL